MKTLKEFEESFKRRREKGYSAMVIRKDGSSYYARSYQTLGTKIYLFDYKNQIIGDVKLSNVERVE
jgi:hypothetical protein